MNKETLGYILFATLASLGGVTLAIASHRAEPRSGAVAELTDRLNSDADELLDVVYQGRSSPRPAYTLYTDAMTACTHDHPSMDVNLANAFAKLSEDPPRSPLEADGRLPDSFQWGRTADPKCVSHLQVPTVFDYSYLDEPTCVVIRACFGNDLETPNVMFAEAQRHPHPISPLHAFNTLSREAREVLGLNIARFTVSHLIKAYIDNIEGYTTDSLAIYAGLLRFARHLRIGATHRGFEASSFVTRTTLASIYHLVDYETHSYTFLKDLDALLEVHEVAGPSLREVHRAVALEDGFVHLHEALETDLRQVWVREQHGVVFTVRDDDTIDTLPTNAQLDAYARYWRALPGESVPYATRVEHYAALSDKLYGASPISSSNPASPHRYAEADRRYTEDIAAMRRTRGRIYKLIKPSPGWDSTQ